MPAVSEGRAPESMRRGALTRRGPPDNRPRMSLRGFFAALLLSILLATPSAAAEWTPHAYAGASTIELRTVAAGEGEQDRKSTRLNSSHLVISYAVFCLKKKKKTKYI